MNLTNTAISPLTPFLQMISASELIAIIAILIGVIWIVYTIILMYHWFRYSYKSRYAAIVFAVHIFVSALIGVFAVSGFFL